MPYWIRSLVRIRHKNVSVDLQSLTDSMSTQIQVCAAQTLLCVSFYHNLPRTCYIFTSRSFVVHSSAPPSRRQSVNTLNIIARPERCACARLGARARSARPRSPATTFNFNEWSCHTIFKSSERVKTAYMRMRTRMLQKESYLNRKKKKKKYSLYKNNLKNNILYKNN